MPPQLTRLFIIFAGLGVLFIVVTWVAEPESFGWYGHYRADALAEQAAQPARYLPRDACAECHDDLAATHKDGVHAKISCQACHGPGNQHAEEPSAENIDRPALPAACLRCHEQSYARPKKFPQIEPAEHTEGKVCNECHIVHNPGEFVEEDAPPADTLAVADTLGATTE